ncbi:uncharacterized protein MYCGRDRAFT_51705, partial [Zymoseptoria tritici IPO323]
NITIDFVVNLPPSKSYIDLATYYNIITITDRITKERYLIPVLLIEVDYYARIFLRYV